MPLFDPAALLESAKAVQLGVSNKFGVETGNWLAQQQDDFIHGEFTLTLHEARNLPNMDGAGGGLTDAYVRIKVDGTKGPKSSTVNDNLNPHWDNEEIHIPVAGKLGVITLDVKDEDMFRPQSIGSIHIGNKEAVQGMDRRWLSIPGGGEICISLRFCSAEEAQKTVAVSASPFRVWDACRLTLYADAHISEETRAKLPPVYTQSGEYIRRSAWEDLHTAIQNARQFIYITGWSVQTTISLLRERPLDQDGMITVGDLLKKKADQGVRVLMLVWDEVMSMDNPILNSFIATTQGGLMNTHDEETRKFFRNTRVECELVTRKGKGISSKAGVISMMTAGLSFLGSEALFTHHQKCVILDSPVDDGHGRGAVNAFMGGLDITGGRFDTPEHHLHCTLETWHKDDYYQGSPGITAPKGPRQPWHDIHCKVEGRVAWDLVTNFEQRWRKQVPKKEHLLFNLHVPSIIPHDDTVLAYQDQWTAQFFRSIDSFSADGCNGVEAGIQEAYIHQIRRAEHFIYIENQYFLGSSKEWIGFDDKTFNVECKHHVCIELAAKVVAKIRARQPFCVYTLLPLHPEGAPGSGAVQAILHWQYKTVEMIYHKIAEALRTYGPAEAHPTDYFSIFFVGTRDPDMPSGGDTALQRLVRNTKRHMIYVHSKMMIVDDEYILIGSANINERSMAGDRDSEMAVGGFQPSHQKQPDGRLPRGDVAAFRHALWTEHLGVWEDIFLAPQFPQCARRVNQMAAANWEYYLQPQPVRMPGHLCTYPYNISQDGKVTAKVEMIPDHELAKAKVLGAPQNTMPNVLTT